MCTITTTLTIKYYGNMWHVALETLGSYKLEKLFWPLTNEKLKELFLGIRS